MNEVQKYEMTAPQEAEALVKSGLFPNLTNVNQCLALRIVGRDLGLSPTAAIQGIQLIKGRPSLSSQLMLALVFRSANLAEWSVETDYNQSTCKMKRKDSGLAYSKTFTMEDAKRANLLGKDNWKLYSKDMLEARSISGCIRKIFPEIVLGLYTPDEVEEFNQPQEAIVAEYKESLPLEKEIQVVSKTEMITNQQRKCIWGMLKQTFSEHCIIVDLNDFAKNWISGKCAEYGLESSTQLTKAQAASLINTIDNISIKDAKKLIEELENETISNLTDETAKPLLELLLKVAGMRCSEEIYQPLKKRFDEGDFLTLQFFMIVYSNVKQRK